jgi:hypothetical protein
MSKSALILAIALSPVLAWSQTLSPQVQVGGVDPNTALNRALKASSLTFEGKPFHAVMDIGTAGEPFTGRIEVWWVNGSKYRMIITTPKFNQVKTVNEDRVQEKSDGDYFPRWLENFVLALFDPVPIANNLREHSDSAVLDPQNPFGCLRRDDRVNGITDQLTYGQVCFSGSEPRVESVKAFSEFIRFRDWKRFGQKQIPRTYETRVLDQNPVVGHLTQLEELKQPDEAMFTVDSVTPLNERISTSFVPEHAEEGLVEKIPAIQWPAVREGKTEGYMIVYARTDRTGQVRETVTYSSDQPALGSFGMQEGLNYKFKPLVVDGVSKQMEMPLVIHFSTRISDPIPLLSVAEMSRQTISCRPSSFQPGLLPKGTVLTARVSVNDKGETVGVALVGRCPVGCGLILGPVYSLKKCQFAPYIVNGRATGYNGDVNLVAP